MGQAGPLVRGCWPVREKDVMRIGEGYLKAGQPLIMKIPGMEGFNRSQIEEVTSGGIVVSMPVSQGEVVSLPQGTAITVQFWDRYANYRFDTVVLGETRSGQVPVLLLRLPDHISRIQRRDFVRLEISCPVIFEIAALREQGKIASPVFTGHTANLSGGGMLLVTDLDLPPKTSLHLAVKLPGGLVVPAMGEVVRMINEIKTKDGAKYWLGIRFTGLEEKDRQALVRFIFEEQRRLRREGKM